MLPQRRAEFSPTYSQNRLLAQASKCLIIIILSVFFPFGMWASWLFCHARAAGFGRGQVAEFMGVFSTHGVAGGLSLRSLSRAKPVAAKKLKKAKGFGMIGIESDKSLGRIDRK